MSAITKLPTLYFKHFLITKIKAFCLSIGNTMNKNINNITRNSFYVSLKSLIQTSFLIIIIIVLQIKVKDFKMHHKSLETAQRDSNS